LEHHKTACSFLSAEGTEDHGAIISPCLSGISVDNFPADKKLLGISKKPPSRLSFTSTIRNYATIANKPLSRALEGNPMKTKSILLPVAVLMTALSSCDAAAEAATLLPPADAGTGVVQVTAELTFPADTATATIPPTLRPTQTLAPSLTFTPSQDFSSAPCHGIKFLADVSIPDDWETGPGSIFTKTWRMQNTGSCAWDSGYRLVYDHGDRMDAPDSQPLSADPVPSGGTSDISVDLTAPEEAGTYQGYFKIRASDGTAFGIGAKADTAFWVRIVVKEGLPVLGPPGSKYVVAEGAIDPGASNSITAVCPSGWAATGGGFSAPQDLPITSQTMEDNGWRVWASNPNSSVRTLTAIAVCLNLPKATTRQATQGSQSISGGGGKASDRVSCPGGSVITGGGFVLGGKGFLTPLRNIRSDNGWTVAVINDGSSRADFTARAVCLSGVAADALSATASVEINPGKSASLQAACPAGRVVTGGGWEFEEGLRVYYSSWYSGQWRIEAVNRGTVPRTLKIQGICLRVS
jgi:hypothetical protein